MTIPPHLIGTATLVDSTTGEVLYDPDAGKALPVKRTPGKRSRVRESLPWPAVVPMPPSTNNLFINGRGKSRVKSPEYRAWIAAVVPLLRRWARPLSYPVKLEFVIRETMRANADLSNRIKAAEDAMVTAGILHGDSLKYVDEVSIRYEPDGVGMAISVVERT